MQPQRAIEGLGYSANEAKVYLAALSLGQCHASDIAKKLKLPLSSTQVIINKLHKDGVLNFYVRKRYKYWVAESPEKLLANLHEREAAVDAVLPYLHALRRESAEKPHVKVFEGVEEIRLVYDDVLDTKQHILGIIPWDDWIRLLGREFMEDFIEKRMAHYLNMRLLAPKTAITLGLHARDGKELRETRFLSEQLHPNTTTLIYGPKTVIVSLNRALPTAVLIEDQDVADTLTLFFEQLWQAGAQ